eukprot:gene5808-11110_t
MMKQQGVPIAKQLDLFQFTCSVSHSLAEATIQRNGRERPSSEAPPEMAPQTDVGTDSVNHCPVHRPDPPRCFHCGEKTRMGCEKCKKGLCLTEKRNCFKDYQK